MQAEVERVSIMSNSTLELDDEVMNLLRQFNQPLQYSAQELILLELYRRGAISSGKAAVLLKMSRTDFIQYASRLGIPYFDFTSNEWTDEVAASKKLGIV
jgi:predicted HTH domain antitoxin